MNKGLLPPFEVNPGLGSYYSLGVCREQWENFTCVNLRTDFLSFWFWLSPPLLFWESSSSITSSTPHSCDGLKRPCLSGLLPIMLSCESTRRCRVSRR